MRALARLSLFALAALGSSIPAHAATPPKQDQIQAVLAPVQALFDGMSHRDPAAILAPLLPGGSMVLMRDGKPVRMTFADFAAHLGHPGTTRIEERIRHPLVRIDHDLAVVWAPFVFLSDGKVDHCGTDLFNLVQQDGQWLIASVADTGRKTCPSAISQAQSPPAAAEASIDLKMAWISPACSVDHDRQDPMHGIGSSAFVSSTSVRRQS